MIPKWQLPLIEKFCDLARQNDLKTSQAVEQWQLLDRLIAEDSLHQTGFWKLRNYREPGKTSFLKRCKDVLEKLEAKDAWKATGLVQRRMSVLVDFIEPLGDYVFENTLMRLLKVFVHSATCHEFLLSTSLFASEITTILRLLPGVKRVRFRPAELFGKPL